MTQLMRSIRALSVCALLFVLGFARMAMAEDRVQISFARAEQVALQAFPGAAISKIERERERGSWVLEVELRDAQGVEHELGIDAHDAHLVYTRLDD